MSGSKRTTIVIDPITHKRAKGLAKEAGMTLSVFIGFVVEGAVKEISQAIRDQGKEQNQLNRIRNILDE